MNERRRLVGVVVSNKMTKTVVVQIGRTFRHPLYRKVVHTSHKVKAHDDLNCQVGDEVQIVESAPISKETCFVPLNIDLVLANQLPEGAPVLLGGSGCLGNIPPVGEEKILDIAGIPRVSRAPASRAMLTGSRVISRRGASLVSCSAATPWVGR